MSNIYGQTFRKNILVASSLSLSDWKFITLARVFLTLNFRAAGNKTSRDGTFISGAIDEFIRIIEQQHRSNIPSLGNTSGSKTRTYRKAPFEYNAERHPHWCRVISSAAFIFIDITRVYAATTSIIYSSRASTYTRTLYIYEGLCNCTYARGAWRERRGRRFYARLGCVSRSWALKASRANPLRVLYI